MYDPNVVGLDMGHKVVGGRATRDWAICVQVREKKPGSSLRPGELRVPPAVEAVIAGHHPFLSQPAAVRDLLLSL